MKKNLLLGLCFLLFTFSIKAQALYCTTYDHDGQGTIDYGQGTIDKFIPSTNVLKVVKSFVSSDSNHTYGLKPSASLIHAKDGLLYGMTILGGKYGYGVIFSFDPSSSVYKKVWDFDGSSGGNPNGSLVQATDGKLYGMTRIGGSRGPGVIFSFDPSSHSYTKLKDFDGLDGGNPNGSLLQARDGKLYGMTYLGGSSFVGVIFSFDLYSFNYKILKEFDGINGAKPSGSLIQANNGKLYGMTYEGGSKGAGTIFSFDPSSSAFIKLKDFDANDGGAPHGDLMQANDGKLYGMAEYGHLGQGIIFSFDPISFSYTTLKDFDGINGGAPLGSLMQASDGKLYGMTDRGGSYNMGTVFSYDPTSSSFSKLKDFKRTNGANPYIGAKFIEVKESIVKVPPTISLTTPTSNEIYLAGTAIMLKANASDTDGSISKVDFYHGDTIIGTVTKPPYSFLWNDASVGSYSITAKATYNDSLATTSDPVRISISNPTVLPFLSITSPAAIDTFAAPASITITAGIRDTNSSIHKIDFYSNDSLLATVTKRPYTFTWKNVAAGIYFITAKATINDTLVITSHASEITVYNASSQIIIPPFVNITNPKATATFTAPAWISISANASDTDGSISKVDFYSNDTLIGTATQSPYTFNWSNVPAGNYSIKAKATDNDGLVTISDTVGISISNPKLAPRVSLTSPVSNATFTAPASIMISANAGDADGSISKVDFYSDGSLIGTAAQSPYTFTWSNVPAGNYSITAKATDNDGLKTVSDTVGISVSNPKLAPYLSLTSPKPNAAYAAPASITISANAGDVDGSITKVDFYSNGTLIGTATQSPYMFTWTNVPAGNYSITAKATDNDQMASSSDIIEISVFKPSPIPGVVPSVSLASPIANSAFAAPASVTITANADDADGYINKVDFYNNDTLIGTSTESPYTFTWQNIPAGNYSITAKASDNDSLVTSSDTVHITVYKARVAPFVNITSPAADKTFAEYSTISVTANAMDNDGSITKVDFYSNDTLIGTATESPYTFVLNNVKAGNYSLTAKATDNDSLVTSSAMVQISVLPNKPPLVTITSPGANETFTSAETITLKAAASDPDGKIAKVEFYNGATLLKSITQYPYAFEWEDVAFGSYKITATATDNFGLKTTSEPVSVIVEAKDSIIVKCAPNPATNTTTISTAGFDQNKPMYVSVIASGIVVKMIEVTNSSQTIQLDVSSLVSGIYTIKLTCGDKVVSKQFLKL